MDARISVDLKELEALTKRYPEESLKARRSRVSEVVLFLQRKIVLKTPEGAGPIHLRDTIFSALSFGEPVTGTVGTPAVYGEAVEFGRGPAFPPIAPILFWVEKKLGLEGKEAKSAAYAIATVMSRSTRLGVHMFEKGFKENEAKVKEILERIPADIVKAVSA